MKSSITSIQFPGSQFEEEGLDVDVVAPRRRREALVTEQEDDFLQSMPTCAGTRRGSLKGETPTSPTTPTGALLGLTPEKFAEIVHVSGAWGISFEDARELVDNVDNASRGAA